MRLAPQLSLTTSHRPPHLSPLDCPSPHLTPTPVSPQLSLTTPHPHTCLPLAVPHRTSPTDLSPLSCPSPHLTPTPVSPRLSLTTLHPHTCIPSTVPHHTSPTDLSPSKLHCSLLGPSAPSSCPSSHTAKCGRLDKTRGDGHTHSSELAG